MSIAVTCFPVMAGETKAVKTPPPPEINRAEESLLAEFFAGKAVEYLDARAQAHEEGKCVNCHATFAYLMARPTLPIYEEAGRGAVRSREVGG